MFGFLKDGKILALTDLAIKRLHEGNTEASQDYFEKLGKHSLKDLQNAYFGSIKFATEKGDLIEILDATELSLPDNAIELITLVWKDDTREIMRLVDNNTATFIGTFSSLVVALDDSSKQRKGK